MTNQFSSPNTDALSLATARKRRALSLLRIAAFTALLVISAAVGKIVIPGNAVGITLQTFALMITALSLVPREAAASVGAYLFLGLIGLPVFSGGIATAAFFGPSAGYLYAFIPAVLVTAALKAPADSQLHYSYLLGFVRNLGATVLGCVVLPLLVGIPVQVLLTGISLPLTFQVSVPFIVNDLLKATAACGILLAARAGERLVSRRRTHRS
jgi:biotin transport system substrate-specific component